MVLAVGAYLRESGDYAFLNERISFYSPDGAGSPEDSASVLEHLRRALAFTRTNTGAHGLPLLGFADWNDTINLPSGAESMMVASLYGTALMEMESLAEYLGDSEWLRWIRESWAEMAGRFRREAWDGTWWRRYFDEEGRAIGSAENEAGKILAQCPELGGLYPVSPTMNEAGRPWTALTRN